MSGLGDDCNVLFQLSPRLGDKAPIPREDDVERCDFGAAEIARLRSQKNRLIDELRSARAYVTSTAKRAEINRVINEFKED